MTYIISNNISYHSYIRMSQSVMPDLECINILVNHVVRNMWNRFYCRGNIPWVPWDVGYDPKF
jgi:hypothetical protein